MKYAKLNGIPVYLMEKVRADEGWVAVQSLKTGETGFVKLSELSGIIENYREVMSKED